MGGMKEVADMFEIAGGVAFIGMMVATAFLGVVSLFWFLMMSRWGPVLKAREWLLGPEMPPAKGGRIV